MFLQLCYIHIYQIQAFDTFDIDCARLQIFKIQQSDLENTCKKERVTFSSRSQSN